MKKTNWRPENTLSSTDGVQQKAAAEQAVACTQFQPDAEEEWAAEEQVSCWNCYNRRWLSADQYVCTLEQK